MRIRRATRIDIPALATIIRKAFKPVAEKFGLNKTNAPTHPSHIKSTWLSREFDRGARYFIGVDSSGKAAGCVSLAVDDGGTSVELRRLAVIPACQKSGFGKKLVERVENECRKLGIRTITFGIIAKHRDLHTWYRKLGFVDTGHKRYPHLPFMVGYMRKTLAGNRGSKSHG